jgi:hypothetical protein
VDGNVDLETLSGNEVLQLILLEKPVVYWAIKWTVTAMCFTLPYILTSVALSLAYIFVLRQERVIGTRCLPRIRSRLGVRSYSW